MLTEFIIIMFSFANSLSLWPKSQPFDGLTVAPHVGAWIEITLLLRMLCVYLVAPHVGAWIQMIGQPRKMVWWWVAPHVGAWIEININDGDMNNYLVAPHVGAWIEIVRGKRLYIPLPSHPTWVRGLKSLWLRLVVLIALSHPTWVRGLKSSLF